MRGVQQKNCQWRAVGLPYALWDSMDGQRLWAWGLPRKIKSGVFAFLITYKTFHCAGHCLRKAVWKKQDYIRPEKSCLEKTRQYYISDTVQIKCDWLNMFCFVKLSYTYHNLDIALLLSLTSVKADASNLDLYVIDNHPLIDWPSINRSCLLLIAIARKLFFLKVFSTTFQPSLSARGLV